MKNVFNLLCNIFNTISFNYNEDTDKENSWSFVDVKKSKDMNYTSFDLFISARFTGFLDFMELSSHLFESYLQEQGFDITDITFRANSNTAEYRLYLTQLSNIE